jgi:hypothetical protein
MTWLLAAYAAVVIAVALYWVRLGRLRRALATEIEAAKRPR